MSIKFSFDRPNKTYKAGDLVKCTAALNLREKLLVNAVTIEYEGYSKTWWTERSNTSRSDEIHECFGSMERYFVDTIGCFESFHERKFDVSIYEYDTEYQLPVRLPTSFTGRYGQVRYKIKMTVSSHLTNIVLEHEEDFFVHSIIDLNMYPQLKIPIVKCKCKRCGVLWLKPDPITVSTSLSKRGFALGETITINIRIINKSSIDVAYIEIRLEEELTYSERRRSIGKCETDILWKKCITGVDKGNTRLFEISIPTNKQDILLLDSAEIIKVRHFIIVTAIAKVFDISVQTIMPVMFGTIPVNVKINK